VSINPLKTIIATQIIGFKNTEGSGPIQVIDTEDNIYFAKSTNLSGLPNSELICEVLGAYFAQIWGLNVAEACLVKIPRSLVDNYLSIEGNTVPSRYQNTDFDNTIFFGVKEVQNTMEIEQYIKGLRLRKEFNLFNQPLDLIKLGIIDMWLGNKDRKPKNPNILITNAYSGKFDFVPIDHCACFGYQRAYKTVNSSHLYLPDNESILSTGLAASILSFAKKRDLIELPEIIMSSISECIEKSDLILNQIPSEWGFSKKAKENIIFVLSEPERNKSLSTSFIRFKPKR
jgi:hypothetical protein